MKKLLPALIFRVAAFGAVCLMVCCGSSHEGPGEASKRYMEYVAAGEYDKYIDGLYIPDGTPADEVAQGKTMLRSLLNEKGSETLEERGGLKSIEVLSEEIAPDGLSATVRMRYTFGNGESSDESNDMVLDADGEWKMKVNK